MKVWYVVVWNYGKCFLKFGTREEADQYLKRLGG